MHFKKPKLNFWQIWNMNVGFFGIQYSFGLQQTAVNPIFSFLGAHHDQLPLLNLAGPVTGLIIQPIIGAMSDKTWSPRWGRRKPYFLFGAILGSLCLFLFPFSPSLWFAVGLLWILDAANNTAMEPYRAFVGDKLPDNQQTFGYQMQSLFVGAGITIANFSLFIFQDAFSSGSTSTTSLCSTSENNSIPTWVYLSFFIGAFFSIATILWSVFKTPEYPPTPEERLEIEKSKKLPFLKKILEPFKDIFASILKMPLLLKQLALVYLFQWYALFCYWQFITPMLKRTLYGITGADEARYNNIIETCKSGIPLSKTDETFAMTINKLSESALGQAGLMNGTYNFVTMIVALALVPFVVKYGDKRTYMISLFLTGIGLISLPLIHNQYLLLVPMIFFGIGWAAMMGLPYSMVSQVIPPEKRGVYMGIVNMMIVIPMGIQTLSFGYILKNFLNDNPVNAIYFAGVLFILAAISVIFLKVKNDMKNENVEISPV